MKKTQHFKKLMARVLIGLISLFIISISFNSCLPSISEDFDYSFKIARTTYWNGYRSDTIVYYYDSNNKLLRIIDHQLGSLRETIPLYDSNYMHWGNDFFFFDSLDRVEGIVTNDQVSILEYEDDLNIGWKKYKDSVLLEEMHFIYENSNAIKDSLIYINQADSSLDITIYQNYYSDEILPSFVVDFKHYLYEYPARYRNALNKKVISDESFYYEYTYEIEDNKVIEQQDFFNTEVDSVTETTIYKYYLLYPIEE